MGWLKPFETGWFETRDGERVLAVHIGEDLECPIVTITKGQTTAWLDLEGSKSRGVKSGKDIVEHLQGCTGWTWKKPNKNAKDIRKCIKVLKLYHQIGQDGQAAIELLATVADRIERESE